jgi:hypothetical protein
MDSGKRLLCRALYRWVVTRYRVISEILARIVAHTIHLTWRFPYFIRCILDTNGNPIRQTQEKNCEENE